jgi:N-acetylmuramoyl-L-alanine amidase
MQNKDFHSIKQCLFDRSWYLFFKQITLSFALLFCSFNANAAIFFLNEKGLEHHVDFMESNELDIQQPRKKSYTIFGKTYPEVSIVSTQLQGAIYYLVSGHGGPDPGAVMRYNGKVLCEDEYAYDITLRLARELISHSATVYMITRDDNDGIRDSWYLPPDSDEKCYPELRIPINQSLRLSQRKNAVNKLFLANKTKYRYHRMIEIHVDSRSVGQKTDVFFYYNRDSQAGKKFAQTMRSTFDKKYEVHQPGRGYHGTVSARNLYMVKYTHPVALFIELGNIKNQRDLQRLIQVSNRQALAKWLAEGCIADFKNKR